MLLNICEKYQAVIGINTAPIIVPNINPFINIEYCNDKLEFTAICEDGTKICYKPLKCQIVKNVTGN